MEKKFQWKLKNFTISRNKVRVQPITKWYILTWYAAYRTPYIKWSLKLRQQNHVNGYMVWSTSWLGPNPISDRLSGYRKGAKFYKKKVFGLVRAWPGHGFACIVWSKPLGTHETWGMFDQFWILERKLYNTILSELVYDIYLSFTV